MRKFIALILATIMAAGVSGQVIRTVDELRLDRADTNIDSTATDMEFTSPDAGTVVLSDFVVGGGGVITGTDSPTFTLDQDNVAAGVDQSFRFNRGSTSANDPGLVWDEAANLFWLTLNSATPAYDAIVRFQALVMSATSNIALSGGGLLEFNDTSETDALLSDMVNLNALGTNAETYTVDTDNAGAENTQSIRFNRGSTSANDVGLVWDAVNDRFNLAMNAPAAPTVGDATLNVGILTGAIYQDWEAGGVDSPVVDWFDADTSDQGWRLYADEGNTKLQMNLLATIRTLGAPIWTIDLGGDTLYFQDMTIGDTAGDNIGFLAEVNTNFDPNAGTEDMGTARDWDEIKLDTLRPDEIYFDVSLADEPAGNHGRIVHVFDSQAAMTANDIQWLTTTTGAVKDATNDTQTLAGVALETAGSAGIEVDVVTFGAVQVNAAGTINAGDWLMPNASGQAIVADWALVDEQTNVIGYALEARSAQSQIWMFVNSGVNYSIGP